MNTTTFNLDPNAAEKRTFRDIYRIRSASYEESSDDYTAKAGGKRMQLTIEWEGLSFRFADNPTENPIMKRSINVTDKNGEFMGWGDPNNPEPTSEDSFPMQMAKVFAKCGTVIGTDPHVLDGHVYVGETVTLRAGRGELKTIIPVERLADDYVFEGEVRILQPREQGQAGNPAAGVAAQSGPTKEAAYKALATALNGRNKSEILDIALGHDVVSAQSDVLSDCTSGEAAITALGAYGSFAADGTFTANDN